LNAASPRRLLRALAAAGAFGLLALHAALLARRLGEPGALDATAAWRWAGALVVQVLALALAVVSLHAPALQGPGEADRAASFWIALPSVLGPALSLLALAAIAASTAPRVAVRGHCRVASMSARRTPPAFTPFAPRPPPHDTERA
jgi:hypothetical protein